ncbi:MAG: TlpA family protein disulfide reductase [Labilithrix sp.]|nr:TlpA family protein disulfide reductase [Labilithrix sp.]MCW5818225.1 TlpA family protein disulfide reductase [Labilithrix sp.]
MRPLFVLLPLLAACATHAAPASAPVPAKASAAPAGPRVYAGQLRLVEVEKMPLRMAPARAADIASLPAPLEPGQRAFAGILPLRKALSKLVLVESASGAFLYLKAGLEGPFAAGDRHPFAAPPAESPQSYEAGDEVVAIDRPLSPGGFIDKFALRVVRSLAREEALRRKGGMKPESRFLFSSTYMAEGTLDVAGRPTLVRYAVDFIESGKVDDGYVALDTNGDGKLDPLSSRETAIKSSDAHVPVFRVGTTYLAPKSYDESKGTFAFEERPSSDYKLFELAVGAPLPDFSFLDVAGKRHRISERRGRYVLLHFWTSYCHPCAAEADHLKEIDAKYRPRGLDIIGLDPEEDLAAANGFLEAHPASWTEAVAATPGNADVSLLVTERFGIRSYPNAIVVDPAGNVLAFSEREPLNRAQVLSVLEEKLGK